MRPLLVLTSFLTFNLTVFSQDKQIKVDTFVAIFGFSSSYILICSDSTFFAAFANCTHVEITRGRWKQAKNEISLLPDTRENIVLKLTIVYEADSKDSFITFHVVDNFGKPFKKYSIALTFRLN